MLHPLRTRIGRGAALIGVLVSGLVVALPNPAGGADAAARAARAELTAGGAIVLGVVEGISEYLPISSTGHLLVTENLLDIGQTKATKDAADTYAITIQAGAILAVLVLFFGRVRSMALGLVGRDENGRHLLVVTLVAFVPAALVGVAFEKPIKDQLFGTWPVIVAWFVGGVVILLFGPRLEARGDRGAHTLDDLTVKGALVIGIAQVFSLWPGTSRSLVTILAGLAIGLSMRAAVEFSFFLGLLVLGAATAFEALKNGKELLDTYGIVNPLIGFLVAFVTAVIAIRWMVTYLQRHGLAIFGWYRIGIATLGLVLLLADVL